MRNHNASQALPHKHHPTGIADLDPGLADQPELVTEDFLARDVICDGLRIIAKTNNRLRIAERQRRCQPRTGGLEFSERHLLQPSVTPRDCPLDCVEQG
jgi:hypothetical protein